jgi:uncharacterized protein YqjF (DUF2071 family)
MEPVFLTAEWRQLVMLNYPIEPAVLAPYVPHGTELDAWNGTTYVSVVAFSFLDTRVKGIAIPFHRDFEEINLRLYVRVSAPEGIRRGVVFVREVVPRLAIATIARWIYRENYVALPTRSEIVRRETDGGGSATYGWKHRGRWLTIGARYTGAPRLPAADSEATFITEHYWGYAAQPDGSTVEYRVEHPPWRVWPAMTYAAEGDLAGFYGADFGKALGQAPTSVFVAEGSPVVVRKGVRIRRAG